ncbi:hypothetical protein [Acetobacterium bakii]|uniref:hypothetical protein n=1 Tax=Acetobacterium bakii TaxID=52689 RepID=UPI001364DD97|nr:hypothetical protein [Acetobacterium bakii]
MFYHGKNEEGQCYMSSHKEKIIPCIAVLIAVTFTVAGFICMKKWDESGCCKKMGK